MQATQIYLEELQRNHTLLKVIWILFHNQATHLIYPRFSPADVAALGAYIFAPD